jgi:type VI secretion system VasD/TssJ family lipoprotein
MTNCRLALLCCSPLIFRHRDSSSRDVSRAAMCYALVRSPPNISSNLFFSMLFARDRIVPRGFRVPLQGIGLICFLCIFFVGCSSTIQVKMNGQPNMNGGGNAADVGIYELTGRGNFLDASPQAFWIEEGTLSGKLVRSPRTRTVYPGEEQTFEFEIAEGTKFIGVAANLYNPAQGEWRALYPLEEVGDWLSMTVSKNRVSVNVEGKGTLGKIEDSVR